MQVARHHHTKILTHKNQRTKHTYLQKLIKSVGIKMTDRIHSLLPMLKVFRNVHY